MTRPTLLLLHGWGFGPDLWDAVVARLPAFQCLRWSRGYFGPAEASLPTGDLLAVGHSLGAMLLGRRLPPAVPLVAINGFDRFAGPGAVPVRVVDRMRKRMRHDPTGVVDAFRARCGAGPAPRIVDEATLSSDLALLADAQPAPACDRSVLSLQGGCDPILPPTLRATVFPHGQRIEQAEAGHLLVLTHPDFCAEQIEAFAWA